MKRKKGKKMDDVVVVEKKIWGMLFMFVVILLFLSGRKLFYDRRQIVDSKHLSTTVVCWGKRIPGADFHIASLAQW